MGSVGRRGPSHWFETHEGTLSKLGLGGAAKRPDASLLLERYLPAFSSARSTATRFLPTPYFPGTSQRQRTGVSALHEPIFGTRGFRDAVECVPPRLNSLLKTRFSMVQPLKGLLIPKNLRHR